MRKLKRSFGSAAIPTVFAAAVTSAALLTSHAAFAETCLTRPDLRAVEGGRWYYRLDRVTKRRCWYQESARWESRNTRPWWRTTPWGTTTERDPNAATSWVASVAALISGKDANEQDNAVQNSRRTEALPERTFKRRARTAWRGDSDARIAGRPANVRRTESKATERETAVSVPPSPPTRQVPASAPSDALERERLFQDFLRWQERRSSPAR